MFEKSREYVSPKEKSGSEKALVWGMAAVIAAIVVLLVAKVSWIAGISGMLVVVPIYLNKKFTKEVACTLTGDKLTVEIIDFKQNRAAVGEAVFIENLEVCAKVSDASHNDALKATYSQTIDARTSPKSENACFAAFERDGKRSLVYFEYNEMMVNEMKKYAEDKIFI